MNKLNKKTKKAKDIKAQVMKQIKVSEVKMKPRAYFVLGSWMLGIGIVAVMMLSTFLMGVIMFHLRMQKEVGLVMILRRFPWNVGFLAVVGLWGGSELIRKHYRGYRVSLGWLIVGVVTAVVGLGFLMDKVGINERARKINRVKKLYELKSPRPGMRRTPKR